jgi:hypothetical protein
MTTEQIIELGSSPNPLQDATVAMAREVKAVLDPFLAINGIFVNLTLRGPANSMMISIDELDASQLPTVALYLFLQIGTPARYIDFGVANLYHIMANRGRQDMVKTALDMAKPGWETDDAILALVAALPGLPPPVTSFVDPPAVAAPDWEHPFAEGHLANRVGDTSPNGTRYTAPSGAVWEKGFWISPFTATWKKV